MFVVTLGNSGADLNTHKTARNQKHVAQTVYTMSRISHILGYEDLCWTSSFWHKMLPVTKSPNLQKKRP